MKDISKEWLEYSKGDLKNAVILFENKSYKDCIWYCHQEAGFKLKVVYAKRTTLKILKTTQEVFKWLRAQLNSSG